MKLGVRKGVAEGDQTADEKPHFLIFSAAVV
jgi:hypothetical protein